MRGFHGPLARSAGVASFALPLLLYVFTLAPTVTLEDSGEFIAVAHHLGVAHPPGYPLWSLVAHGFTWLPWGSIAQRVHLCSAVFAALTCWLTFLVAWRITGQRVAALGSALALGASGVFWSQAVIAEVYTLNSFFTLLLLYGALRWTERRQRRWLYLLALSVGLGFANHHLIALAALPILVWLLLVDWRRLLEPGVLIGGALLLAVGLSVYLYLPVRAASQPPVNVGNPDSLAKTLTHINREMYKTGQEQLRYLGDARAAWRHGVEAWVGSGRSLSWPISLIAVAGAVLLGRRRRGLLATTLGIALLDTFVLNAMLRAQFNPYWVFVHRVYYIPMQAMLALWLAPALACATTAAGRRRWARVSLVGLLGFVLAAEVARSLPVADRSGDRRARDFALDLLDSAPRGAGFLATDDEVVYPLTYMKWVEGVRRDIHVLAEDLGWRGERVTVYLTVYPPGEAMFEEQPALRRFTAVPHGLVYMLVPAHAAPVPTYGSFVPLPHAPRDAQLERRDGDVFADFVRARYAAYHARVGAKHQAAGRAEEARRAFGRAEALNPEDPYVTVLLVEIYRHYGIHRERWIPMLRGSLAGCDRLDPAVHRYYPLRRADIERLLRELEAS